MMFCDASFLARDAAGEAKSGVSAAALDLSLLLIVPPVVRVGSAVFLGRPGRRLGDGGGG